jgi:hypothetical protein
LHICNHVTEKCFESSPTHKNPCPHAVEHGYRPDCLGSRCDRWADWDEKDMARPVNPVYIKHVKI